jgi:hypothetical protein
MIEQIDRQARLPCSGKLTHSVALLRELLIKSYIFVSNFSTCIYVPFCYVLLR